MKEKKCKHCKSKFTPSRPLQVVCGFNCAKVYVKKENLKTFRKQIKVEKERLETLSQLKKKLQSKINKIALNIDTNFPCISSGRTTGQMQGGHYYTVGGNPEIRFNLINIWKQSSADNNHKHGNIVGYRESLRMLGFINDVESLKMKEPLKSDKFKLKEMIGKANNILLEQKKGNYIAETNEERLSIRKILNDFLLKNK